MPVPARRALVVGAGTGWDAELIADLGYDTTAFDISPTAVEAARQSHPGSKAEYVTADLLAPPAEWHHAFDLVVEIYTVQALPIELQPAAIKQVGEQVGPGGTLLVIAAARADDQPDEAIEGPPWPLTRAAIDSFATSDLRRIQVVQSPHPADPDHPALARRVPSRLSAASGSPKAFDTRRSTEQTAHFGGA